jgi:hypothetical protein
VSRKTVSEIALLEILIDETGRRLGNDANHLLHKITITRKRNVPNWDAEIAVVGLATNRAFTAALQKMQKLHDYDVVWR